MQLFIENMTCGSCVKHVTQAIEGVDPLAKVEADTVTHKVVVYTTATGEDIIKALEADGYRASIFSGVTE